MHILHLHFQFLFSERKYIPVVVLSSQRGVQQYNGAFYRYRCVLLFQHRLFLKQPHTPNAGSSCQTMRACKVVSSDNSHTLHIWICGISIHFLRCFQKMSFLSLPGKCTHLGLNHRQIYLFGIRFPSFYYCFYLSLLRLSSRFSSLHIIPLPRHVISLPQAQFQDTRR